MSNHLNIFEYYSHQGTLPIENNSTRNIGIVLKNNPLGLDRFFDLINKSLNDQAIEKPESSDDWDIRVQVKIEKLAEEELEIQRIIGATLTTEHQDFYENEVLEDDVNNITDMIILSRGTLIIIEAKRNNVNATKQLKKQVNEFIDKRKGIDSTFVVEHKYISLTWDEVVESLNHVNFLLGDRDAILHDYIEHIKYSAPSFFPVQTFDKLNQNDFNQIKRRIERFAKNYRGNNEDIVPRMGKEDTVYWVRLHDKDYVKELCYQNYGSELELQFYIGNTVGQGYALYNSDYNLSVLDISDLRIKDYSLKVICQPNMKISDAWGKWKFDTNVNTKDSNVLREIFHDICGRKKSENNQDLYRLLDEYSDVINLVEFKEKFSNAFKKSDHSYTFLISLTVGIYIKTPIQIMAKIDKTNPISMESDSLVEFTKEIEAVVYRLIEQ